MSGVSITQVMVNDHIALQHLCGRLRLNGVPFRWRRVRGGYLVTSTRKRDLSQYMGRAT